MIVGVGVVFFGSMGMNLVLVVVVGCSEKLLKVVFFNVGF